MSLVRKVKLVTVVEVGPKAPFSIATAQCILLFFCKIVLLNVSCKKSKVGDRSRGRPEGSLFNSYSTMHFAFFFVKSSY